MSLLAMSLGSNLYASDDTEYVEVTAPNECCQTPLPGSLGMLVGWASASGAAASGTATVRAAARQAAAKKIAEQREKNKQEKKEESEQSQYEKFAENNPSWMAVLVREAGVTVRALFAGGSVSTAEMSDENGRPITIKDCVPGGPANPNAVKCTQQKFELFVDPTDNLPRWAWTFSSVEAAYNPKHIEADSSGYYPKVVGNQTITLVFDTEADLIAQIQDLAAGR